MGLAAIKIAGADAVAKNSDGTNYKSSGSQCLIAGAARVHHVTVFTPTTDVYVVLFDSASIPGTLNDPKFVLFCPSGLTSAMDFTDGRIFNNGIYFIVATAVPGTFDPTQAWTAGANDLAQVEIGYRKE